MAVPKRKKSKSRTRMHRAHHALTAANFQKCPECGEMKLPHRICPFCHKYKGVRYQSESATQS